MANGLLCGEKIILAVLLGTSTLWGERYFAEMFDDNFVGDTVDVLEVLIDSAGDKKTSPRTIFPWLLAEDKPVINSGGA